MYGIVFRPVNHLANGKRPCSDNVVINKRNTHCTVKKNKGSFLHNLEVKGFFFVKIIVK